MNVRELKIQPHWAIKNGVGTRLTQSFQDREGLDDYLNLHPNCQFVYFLRGVSYLTPEGVIYTHEHDQKGNPAELSIDK